MEIRLSTPVSVGKHEDFRVLSVPYFIFPANELRLKKWMWERLYYYLRCSENKAWKKKIRELNPWPLQYRCRALPIELTSQLGADYYVGS